MQTETNYWKDTSWKMWWSVVATFIIIVSLLFLAGCEVNDSKPEMKDFGKVFIYETFCHKGLTLIVVGRTPFYELDANGKPISCNQ